MRIIRPLHTPTRSTPSTSRTGVLSMRDVRVESALGGTLHQALQECTRISGAGSVAAPGQPILASRRLGTSDARHSNRLERTQGAGTSLQGAQCRHECDCTARVPQGASCDTRDCSYPRRISSSASAPSRGNSSTGAIPPMSVLAF